MFENTLLIIKSDYLHKRKPVLLHLLQKGFFIQGQRRILFSPEHAAEFYKDCTDDKSFMLQVILLSRGNSEAFILTKENAVIDLLNTMICYFCTSVEMDRNVHVTKCPGHVQREISFIFPNYIHHPIGLFDREHFNRQPYLKPMVNELYEMLEKDIDTKANWKLKLAEWLMLSNKNLPHVSNQCSYKPLCNFEEKAQQTIKQSDKDDLRAVSPRHSPSISFSSAGSSMLPTSSSCITCSCFDGGTVCLQPPKEEDSCVELVIAKTEKLPSVASTISEEHICEDHICEEHSQCDEMSAEDEHDVQYEGVEIEEEQIIPVDSVKSIEVPASAPAPEPAPEAPIERKPSISVENEGVTKEPASTADQILDVEVEVEAEGVTVEVEVEADGVAVEVVEVEAEVVAVEAETN